MSVKAEFINCLNTISHVRAGWDYDLPADRRTQEDDLGKEALDRLRSIWVEHPDQHDTLLAAYAFVSPLVSMREIETAL